MEGHKNQIRPGLRWIKTILSTELSKLNQKFKALFCKRVKWRKTLIDTIILHIWHLLQLFSSQISLHLEFFTQNTKMSVQRRYLYVCERMWQSEKSETWSKVNIWGSSLIQRTQHLPLWKPLVFSFNVAQALSLASLTMASKYGHVSIQFSLVWYGHEYLVGPQGLVCSE